MLLKSIITNVALVPLSLLEPPELLLPPNSFKHTNVIIPAQIKNKKQVINPRHLPDFFWYFCAVSTSLCAFSALSWTSSTFLSIYMSSSPCFFVLSCRVPAMSLRSVINFSVASRFFYLSSIRFDMKSVSAAILRA